MDLMIAGLPKRPCLHVHAAAAPRCKDCGKVTFSHKLRGTVEEQVQCPSCGTSVTVVGPEMRCHTCWLKAKVPEEL